MRLSSVFISLTLALGAVAVPATIEKRSISSTLFKDLVWYFQYASSAYTSSCPNPNGNTLVIQIDEPSTDTQGYIARDDKRGEIVVVFRGNTTRDDLKISSEIKPTFLDSPGVLPPADATVHTGWLAAYNSVAKIVLTTVKEQLSKYPKYSLVTDGHGMGGSLAILAAVSLKSNFPGSPLRVYTYGQPRTMNPSAAFWVNKFIGDKNIFRSVHTIDGTPTNLIPQSVDYRHHGTEYWQFVDPSSPAVVNACAPNGEDPACSTSVFGTPANPAHYTYYNIPVGTLFC